jgi:NADPH2:quinone reductase
MISQSIPKKCLSIEIAKGDGSPETLRPVTLPMPQYSDEEVLIKVEAAGINRPDILQREGLYPPPKGASPIPGLEVAGTVIAIGSSVSNLKVGDEVCALVTGGGYATHAVASEKTTLPIPKGLSFIEAAGIPETFFTVWSNVFDRAGLQRGETFLVHGGTSGIGTTAIQLAKAFGATVIATSGSDVKVETARKLGADLSINYKKIDFVSAVKEFTNKRGANVILDMIGGDYIERNWTAASVEGRIVQIAFLNGPIVEANFQKLMLKRLTHTGSTLRARDTGFKAAIAQHLRETVWPLFESGMIKVIIDSVFLLKEASAAHRHMETSKHIGKIILKCR